MDFNYQGSLGAGFSINRGITSTVRVFQSSNKNYEIKLNGFSDCELKVSKYVTEYYMSLVQIPVLISVDHESNLPIGYGMGSSGSAALSLSYALNDALDINLSKLQSAQIAHQADIVCNTGRGTVVSEYVGGLDRVHGGHCGDPCCGAASVGAECVPRRKPCRNPRNAP